MTRSSMTVLPMRMGAPAVITHGGRADLAAVEVGAVRRPEVLHIPVVAGLGDPGVTGRGVVVVEHQRRVVGATDHDRSAVERDAGAREGTRRSPPGPWGPNELVVPRPRTGLDATTLGGGVATWGGGAQSRRGIEVAERTTRNEARTNSQSRARNACPGDLEDELGHAVGLRASALGAVEQGRVTDADRVAVGQLPGLHRRPVDRGPVGRPEVGQGGLLAVPVHLEVTTRDPGVGETELGVLSAADDVRAVARAGTSGSSRRRASATPVICRVWTPP